MSTEQLEVRARTKIAFHRLCDVDQYFWNSVQPDVSFIAMGVFIGLYLASFTGAFIIATSLIKLMILLVHGFYEWTHQKDYASLLVSRSRQFWLYRVILLIQLALFTWVLYQIASYQRDTQ